MDKVKLANDIAELAGQIKDSTGSLHRAWIKLKRAEALVRASDTSNKARSKPAPELKK